MNTIGCQLNGKSEARGRNGWFAPHRAVMMDFNKTAVHDRQLVIEVWSKSRVANLAPIMLCLTETDAETLITLLSRGLKTFQETNVEEGCEALTAQEAS